MFYVTGPHFSALTIRTSLLINTVNLSEFFSWQPRETFILSELEQTRLRSASLDVVLLQVIAQYDNTHLLLQLYTGKLFWRIELAMFFHLRKM